MDDIAFFVLVALLSAILGLLVGFSMGREYAADGCRDYGSFKVAKDFYDCKPRT